MTKDGQLVERGLADYVIPSAVDIPHIDVVHIERLFGRRRRLSRMVEGGRSGRPPRSRMRFRRASGARPQFQFYHHSGADVQAAWEKARTKAKGSQQ